MFGKCLRHPGEHHAFQDCPDAVCGNRCANPVGHWGPFCAEPCTLCKSPSHYRRKCGLFDKDLCFNCGQPGHFAENCREMCRICNSVNHSSFHCPRRVNTLTKRQSDNSVDTPPRKASRTLYTQTKGRAMTAGEERPDTEQVQGSGSSVAVNLGTQEPETGTSYTQDEYAQRWGTPSQAYPYLHLELYDTDSALSLANQSCDMNLMRDCDLSEIKPGLVLINVDSIDLECRYFKHAFDCAEKYLSGCTKTLQMVWRTLQAQVHVVCNTSKSVYEESAECWGSSELEEGVMDCNKQYSNSLGDTHCGDIDNYESCLESKAAELCDASAAKVMRDMTGAYMSEIRKVCQPQTRTTMWTSSRTSSDTQTVLSDVSVAVGGLPTSTTGTSNEENASRQTEVTRALVGDTEQKTSPSTPVTGQLSQARSLHQTFVISIFSSTILVYSI